MIQAVRSAFALPDLRKKILVTFLILPGLGVPARTIKPLSWPRFFKVKLWVINRGLKPTLRSMALISLTYHFLPLSSIFLIRLPWAK